MSFKAIYTKLPSSLQCAVMSCCSEVTALLFGSHSCQLNVHCLDIMLYSKSHLGHAAAKSLQSCPTLCDPIDGSPPGSAVPGILQARTLEWVAISFSNA